MIVMYAGRMVEHGNVDDVLSRPRHPYTKGLIGCVPHLMATLTDSRPELTEISGIVPGLNEFGQNACLFASRCNLVGQQCVQARPKEKQFENTQLSACWHAESV